MKYLNQSFSGQERPYWLQKLLSDIESAISGGAISVIHNHYNSEGDKKRAHCTAYSVPGHIGVVPGIRVATIDSEEALSGITLVTITYSHSMDEPGDRVVYSATPPLVGFTKRRSFEKMAQDVRSFLMLAKTPEDLFFRPRLVKLEGKNTASS